VAALTEDPAIEDYAERKRALRQSVVDAGFPALAVFAADKLARMRVADRTGLLLFLGAFAAISATGSSRTRRSGPRPHHEVRPR
jgi:hypothetical protein